MAGDGVFDITARPERSFDHGGGLSYDGGTLFALEPVSPPEVASLEALVLAVLDAGPYRYGDFLDLPMPLWLVRDDETGDVFRVSVRDGTVRLHVLPETESAGLRALYDRLVARSGVDWTVHRRTDG